MRIKLTAPVRHDGKIVDTGSVIEIDGEGGERLVRLGVAEAADAAPANPAPMPETPVPETPVPETPVPETPENVFPAGSNDDPPADRKPLESMNKAELQTELKAIGVSFRANMNHAELVALLRREELYADLSAMGIPFSQDMSNADLEALLQEAQG